MIIIIIIIIIIIVAICSILNTWRLLVSETIITHISQ